MNPNSSASQGQWIKIYSRLPRALNTAFSLACIRRGVNRPPGLQLAIAQWVRNEQAAEHEKIAAKI